MTPYRLSKVEAAIRAVLAFNEAFNRHDVPGMMALMSDECVFESTGPAPDGEVYEGKDAVTRYWQQLFSESPEAHIDIEEIFSLGERCIMRWRYSWVDEAGDAGHIRGVDVFRVRDKLIQEKFSYVKG